MSIKNEIAFITTGGSIDKSYSCYSSNFEIEDSLINQILSNALVSFKYQVRSILKKDSLDINLNDRMKIYDVVKKLHQTKLIITHGTDTMNLTANFLKDLAKEKTIVITGSLKPAIFSNTDAVLNIGMAVSAVQILPPGVYIAMNGLVLSAENIEKDMKKMQFKAKASVAPQD